MRMRPGQWMTRQTWASILIPIAVGACLVACRSSTPPVNILILSVDTLRADRLGSYGNDDWNRSPSPNIDRLAARGTVFDRSYAPRGQTRPSVASFLTGKYPITTGVRENGTLLRERHLTFIQRLAAAGHQTGAFLANFQTDSMGSGWAYRGAKVVRQGENPGERLPQARQQVLWDDRVEQAALDFLDGIDGRRPFTAYVHFFDVHKPYNPPSGYDLYGHYADMPEPLRQVRDGESLHAYIDEITRTDRPVEERELQRIRGLYDGAITATDDRIGRVLEKLEQVGARENTVIVFTSDHGEELFDRHRYAYHGNSIYEGVLRVPLIIAGPGLDQGKRSSVPVMNVDVSATLLELAGLPVPDDVEGISLAELLRGRSDEPLRSHLFFEWRDEVYAVSDGRHVYVHNPHHAELLKSPFIELQDPAYVANLSYTPTRLSYPIACYEGYDTEVDPLQRHNLLDNASETTAHFDDLHRALAAWLSEPQHEKKMSWPGLEQHAEALNRELDQLRSLGYVGIASQMEGGPTDRRYLSDCADR
jgi:arylsulfatase A-like enzyme